MIELRPSVRLNSQVLATLHAVAQALNNARSGGWGPAAKALLNWASDSEQRLRMLIPSHEMDRLVRTRRVEVVAHTAHTEQIVHAAVLELDQLAELWQQELTEIGVWQRRWSDVNSLVVPDTNVLMHHEGFLAPKDDRELATFLDYLPFEGIHLVVPMVVVDELDRLKDRGGDHGQRTLAGRAQRILVDLFDFSHPDGRRVLRSSSIGRVAEGWSAPLSAVTVEILGDRLGHRRLDRPDDELIARSAHLQDMADRNVLFVTQDLGASLRARRAGLKVRRLERPNAPAKKQRAAAEVEAPKPG